MPKFIRVRDTDTPDEIAEAVRHLRAKQERTELTEVRAEIGETIDELVAMWCERVRVGR